LIRISSNSQGSNLPQSKRIGAILDKTQAIKWHKEDQMGAMDTLIKSHLLGNEGRVAGIREDQERIGATLVGVEDMIKITEEMEDKIKVIKEEIKEIIIKEGKVEEVVALIMTIMEGVAAGINKIMGLIIANIKKKQKLNMKILV
jgi:hypothetical protein